MSRGPPPAGVVRSCGSIDPDAPSWRQSISRSIKLFAQRRRCMTASPRAHSPTPPVESGRSSVLPGGEVVNEAADTTGGSTNPRPLLSSGQRADGGTAARPATDDEQILFPRPLLRMGTLGLTGN